VGAAITAVRTLDTPIAGPAAPPSSGRRTITLAAVYYLLAAFAVTLWLWRDPASRTVAGNPNDADQFTWFFRYDATAIAHGHLPALVTTAMNAPQGVNAMWNTFMMLPGVLLAPVTLLLGPQTALTVFLTAGFAGSAIAMFAVLRRWGASLPAAALAGAVYAFSPALVHSAIGHYDLQFAVLPPLIVDAGLALAAGRARAVRGGVRLGLLVTAQVFITEETLLGTAMAGVLFGIVLAAARPRALLGRLRPAAGGLAVAAGVTAVIAGYPLWVQFLGPLAEHGSPFTPDFFKNDLSSFVVPSSYLLFHTAGSAAQAAAYQGHLPEYLGYLGWPLLIVLAAASVAFWRRPPVRAAAVTFVVLEVFSLGGTLLFAGREHAGITLPWHWLQGLPLLRAALPDRFSIVADGAAAVLLAFAADAAMAALAGSAAQRRRRLGSGSGRLGSGRLGSGRLGSGSGRPGSGRLGSGRLGSGRLGSGSGRLGSGSGRLGSGSGRLGSGSGRLGSGSGRLGSGWLAAGWRPAAVVMSGAVLAVLPIVPRPLPAAAATPLPPGWSQAFAALRLPASAPVLVVPLPMSTFTEPLRWQADTGAPGSMVGGYFMGPASNGRDYIDGNGTPAAGLYLNELWLRSPDGLPVDLGAGVPGSAHQGSPGYIPVKKVSDAAMLAQIRAWRVGAVVAVARPGSPLGRYLTRLLGPPAVAAGDVLAWRR
jgi:hypothetical protein